jgi:pyruvate dehydrogenase E2 component (dihydrolipoamide acetyltransferase)
MAVELRMPRFGLTMHEGTVRRLFKTAGDAVAAGDALYEVETEKVLYEVEAPQDGTLAVVVVEEGATVPCGGLIGVIAEPKENVEEVAKRYAAVATAQAAPSPAPVSGGPVAKGVAPTAARSPASPLARKRAAELGVELERIAGTGPGGRITREDVERAAAFLQRQPAAASESSPAVKPAALHPETSPSKPVHTVPFAGARRTIAHRLHQSLLASAQITLTTEVDVGPAARERERLRRQGLATTWTDLAIWAAARALRRHPRLKARLEEDQIIEPAPANIGFAVALDEGIIVPVVCDAAAKSIATIAAERRALAERARTGKLTLEEVSGANFTITNLGSWGIDAFTPIVNLGQAAILGLGRLVRKPAVFEGQVAIRPMVTFSLSFDHRLVDGAPAAAFLQTFVAVLNTGGQEAAVPVDPPGSEAGNDGMESDT